MGDGGKWKGRRVEMEERGRAGGRHLRGRIHKEVKSSMYFSIFLSMLLSFQVIGKQGRQGLSSNWGLLLDCLAA